MKIRVGVSNHHIHLTEKDYKILFPNNKTLEFYKKDDLYQPGMYSTTLFLTIKTSKNIIEDVRIIGPLRNYTQAEISKTDSYKLGINPPIANSGELESAIEIALESESNSIKRCCCIIAKRHIHLSKSEQEENQIYEDFFVKIDNVKAGILSNIDLKISESSKLELHIDQDDANAFLLKNGDEIELFFH